MTQESINRYLEKKAEYIKEAKIFDDNCYRVIQRFSDIEDMFDKSMIGVFYEGAQIYMNESKAYGDVKCDFNFQIYYDLILVENKNFNTHSSFDIKYLLMDEDEFMKVTQNVIDEQKTSHDKE